MSSKIATYLPEVLPCTGLSSSDREEPNLSDEVSCQALSSECLLYEVSRGNKVALSVLLLRHGAAVYHVAFRILKDESEAEDLRQELFIYIFQRASIFDPGKGTAASWIIQIAYHRAIDRRRHLQSRHHYKEHIPADEQSLPRASSNFVDKLDVHAILQKLRDELSAEQLQTLELHFFEGYSFREIAEKTGQNYGNVRNHYYRAIQRLREHVIQGKAGAK